MCLALPCRRNDLITRVIDKETSDSSVPWRIDKMRQRPPRTRSATSPAHGRQSTGACDALSHPGRHDPLDGAESNITALLGDLGGGGGGESLRAAQRDAQKLHARPAMLFPRTVGKRKRNTSQEPDSVCVCVRVRLCARFSSTSHWVRARSQSPAGGGETHGEQQHKHWARLPRLYLPTLLAM